MIEVEIKVRANHSEVKPRLDELSARKTALVEQTDVYYSAPHRDFASTDEALRIRIEREGGTEKTELTYKGPKIDDETKSREEFEVEIGGSDEMNDVLEALGFEEFESVTKTRTVYEVEELDCEVLLDDVRGLGEFVEVEAEIDPDLEDTFDEEVPDKEDVFDGEDTFDDARNRAHTLLERLGLDHKESIRESYLGLLIGD